MKIAFVGKGGSGKSSISWLAVKTLESMQKSVLAIDADHNMDLTSNLGLNPEDVPLMHKTNEEFMRIAGLLEDKKWSRLVTEEDRVLPSFSANPKDEYTKLITTEISENLSLINVGLGSEDVLFEDRCAHGLSGPLKYYLAMLEEGDSWVVIDSVAGTDMLNFGLYGGIDAVIGIVEPHRNSVKVFEQIQALCSKTSIPCYAILNKPVSNEFHDQMRTEYYENIIGEIPLDIGIVAYDYSLVSLQTKEAMQNIIAVLGTKSKTGGVETLRNFHKIKMLQ